MTFPLSYSRCRAGSREVTAWWESFPLLKEEIFFPAAVFVNVPPLSCSEGDVGAVSLNFSHCPSRWKHLEHSKVGIHFVISPETPPEMDAEMDPDWEVDPAPGSCPDGVNTQTRGALHGPSVPGPGRSPAATLGHFLCPGCALADGSAAPLSPVTCLGLGLAVKVQGNAWLPGKAAQGGGRLLAKQCWRAE